MAAGSDVATAHKARNDNINAGPGAGIAALRPAPTARGGRRRPRGRPDGLAAGALDERAARQQRVEDRLGQTLEEGQVVQHLQIDYSFSKHLARSV